MVGFLGIDKVVKNLADEIKKIEGATEAGVLTAALHVRGEAQKLSPVDEGNLKNSAYVVSRTVTNREATFVGKKSGQLVADHNTSVIESKGEVVRTKMPMAIVGFSAYYAVYVHEINRPRTAGGGGYTVGQWKYLETVLIRDRKFILDIIRRKAKI